jgi:hypothetical protein
VSTQTFVAAGTLIVATVLVLFGSGKLRPRPQGHPPALGTAADAILAKLPSAARLTFWPVLGAAEVALGFWLMLGHGSRLPSLVAAGLFTAMLAYLIWAKLRHPGKSCGCSGRHQEPVTGQSIGRGVFLLGLTAVAGFEDQVPNHWYAFATPSVLTAALLGAIVVGGLSVSPSRRKHVQLWLNNLKEWFAVRRFSDEAVRKGVEATDIWLNILASCAASSFTPILRDSWRHGAWQTLEYAVKWCDSDAVVIAAHHLSAEPPWIKLVILRKGAVVASWDSFGLPQPTASHEAVEQKWQTMPPISRFG